MNRDGQVNILDMILIARHLGEPASANSPIDVNGDGTINVLDLILISQHLDEAVPAAPGVFAINGAEVVQGWISCAYAADDGSLAFREGILKLQLLLERLTVPDKTALLANYPNPFNLWMQVRL